MTTFCVFENRADHAPGLHVLIASLARTSPGARVMVGGVEPSGVAMRLAQDLGLEPRHVAEVRGGGWDVKPEMLLAGLAEAGKGERVTWIDADVVATRDLRPMLHALEEPTLLLADEHRWGQHRGGDHRARAWGLKPGRALPGTTNSGVVSATHRHQDLLEAWRGLLEDERYRDAQRRAWRERPIHLLGDQEVLAALLAWNRFADVPIRWLRGGRDIIQAFGPGSFAVRDRLAVALGRRPLMVHAMGPRKPWDATPPTGLRPRYRAWHNATNLYTAAAAAVLDDLPASSRTGLLSRRPGLSYAGQALLGLPLAGVDAAARRGKRALRRDRYHAAVSLPDAAPREPYGWVERP